MVDNIPHGILDKMATRADRSYSLISKCFFEAQNGKE